MLEVKLYEIVPDLNQRAEMGRVLVTPTPTTIPEKREPEPRQTGKYFVCCNRIFLTLPSLESHKTDNTCRNSSNSAYDEEGDEPMSRSQALQCLFDSVKKKYSSTTGIADSTLPNVPTQPEVEPVKEEYLEPKSTIKDFNASFDTIKMNGLTNFSCRQCAYRTTNLHLIKRHVKSMHVNKEIDMNSDPKKVETLYSCDLCHIYKTPYKHNIIPHKQNAHAENGEHRCAHCTCCYASQSGLTVHVRTFHRDKTESSSVKKKTSMSKTFEDPLFTPIIVKTNKTNDAVKVKSRLEVPKPGTPVRYASSITTPSRDETLNATNIPCTSCGFIAKHKAALNFHLKVAHVQQGVECECGCSFATATNLTNHKLNDCPKSTGHLKDKNRSPQEFAQIEKNQEIADVESKMIEDSVDDSLGGSKNCKEAIQNVTARESRVRCKKCGLLLKNQKGLTTHYVLMHSHTEVSHKFCELCNYRTRNYHLYRKHKKMCHVVNGIKCPAVNCTCSFRGVEGLSLHFITIHKQKLDRNSLELKCDKCDYVTYKESSMERHVMRGHETKVPRPVSEPTIHKCKQCNFTTPTRTTLEAHEETNHVENGFKCDFCNNSFKTMAGVRIHSYSIHKDNPGYSDVKTYKCDHCDYTTTAEHHLNTHITTNHVKDGFDCQFCSSSFSTTSGLRTHVSMMHKNADTEDYSSCKLCGAQTGGKKGYKEHYERCHVGPVKCPDCVCSFKHFEGLSRHVQIMHKRKLDRRLYLLKCSYSDCKYTTCHAANLRHHEKSVHSKEKLSNENSEQEECTICNRKISGSLEDHLSRAHVDGGFACAEKDCKCSFRTRIGLIRHMRGLHGKKFISTNENVRDPAEYPIKCDRCNFRCKVVGDLNRHCTKLHGFIHTDLVPREKSRNVCDICKAETSETLANHKMRYHVQNGFKCLKPGCPCSFETFVSRARHMMKAHRMVSSKICQICKLKYIGTLKHHFEKCHVENGVKCMHDECPCTFETEIGRAVHMRVQHNKFIPKQPRKCDLCRKTVTGTMQQHIDRCHVPNGVKCMFGDCPCAFETEQGRAIHMRIQHNKGLPKQPKNCHICGNTVSETMQLHIERCHVPNGTPCGFCSCSFETELGLARHMRSRHNVQVSTNCTICGIEPVVSMNTHMKQSHVPGGLPCSKCECTFQSDTSRIRHLARYHNIVAKPTPKHCSLCNMIVKGISLSEHIERHHVPNGYRCKYCNCSLRTKKGKFVHMFKMHKNEIGTDPSMSLDRICKLCGIKVNESITKHMERNHSSLNTFKCHYCCSKFGTSKGRIRHVISCHKKGRADFKRGKGTSGTKIESISGSNKLKLKLMPFLCPDCSCKFVSKTARQDHIQLFHSASTTSAKTRQGHNLKFRDVEDFEKNIDTDYKEVKVESPKLQLICGDCGYSAKSQSQLNMHMQKSHVKGSKFACTFCKCSYTTEKELVRHQKISHIKEYLRSKNSILKLYGADSIY